MQVLRSVDTIAEFIAEPARGGDACVTRGMPAVINALTVDVEEWFHICGVPALGPGRWDASALARGAHDARGCSICSPRPAPARPSSSRLGGRALSASRRGDHSRWPRRGIARPSGIAARTTRESRDSPSDLHPEPGRAVGRRRSAYRRVSRARSGRSTVARCGRFPCSRPHGIRRRREHGAAPDGGVDQLSAAAVRPIRPAAGRSSKCRRSSPIASARTIPMGWGWGLRMSAPAPGPGGDRAGKPGGRPAVLTIHPWEIDPRSASRTAACRPALRPLLPSGRICRSAEGRFSRGARSVRFTTRSAHLESR